MGNLRTGSDSSPSRSLQNPTGLHSARTGFTDKRLVPVVPDAAFGNCWKSAITPTSWDSGHLQTSYQVVLWKQESFLVLGSFLKPYAFGGARGKIR